MRTEMRCSTPSAAAIAACFRPKPRYSAFDQTPIELLLRELGVERIRLAGAATEMCVLQTAIAASQLGFELSVLADACATVDEANERLALDYLERVAGIDVVRAHAEPASVDLVDLLHETRELECGRAH